MAGVTFKNISKKYYNYPNPNNEVRAVSDFNLEVRDGEIIVLVGPSGCGKTTTLRMVAGLEEITGGELYIGDTLVNDVHSKDRDIALVFQNYALYPHMTVFENIAFGLKPTDISEEEIKEKVEKIARMIDVTHLFERKPKELSGGQKQRVALGRALVKGHKVILLDEPLSHLDAKLRTAMRMELMKLHQEFKTTFIYVTHDQDEAMMTADRIVVMKDGFIQQVDTPEYLYSHPRNMFVAGFLGFPMMNFFNSKVSESNGDIFIDFGGLKIKLPESKVKNTKIIEYVNKEIICGIRPEHMYEDEAVIAKYNDFLLNAEVKIKCFKGRETYLNFTVKDDINSNYDYTACVSPDCAAESGDTIKFAVNPEKIYLFDKDTEMAIVN